MTFLEAKKIVEDKGYHVVKNSEGESFRERVAREEAKRIVTEDTVADRGWNIQVEKQDCDAFYRAIGRYIQKYGDINYTGMGKALYAYEPGKTVDEYYEDIVRAVRGELEEAIRIAEEAGYQLIREDEEIEDDDELDEGCCGCDSKKKKGKKKSKKSDFVPFWAKKKDKVDEALEDDLDLEGMTLDEAITLDEGFGTAGGTPLSQLCADYIKDDYFTKLANEVGLEVAKAEFLEKAHEVTGDKYYKTLSARIQAAKTATAVLFVLQGTMFGGSNMDLAAGTRQSAYHRNRR